MALDTKHFEIVTDDIETLIGHPPLSFVGFSYVVFPHFGAEVHKETLAQKFDKKIEAVTREICIALIDHVPADLLQTVALQDGIEITSDERDMITETIIETKDVIKAASPESSENSGLIVKDVSPEVSNTEDSTSFSEESTSSNILEPKPLEVISPIPEDEENENDKHEQRKEKSASGPKKKIYSGLIPIAAGITPPSIDNLQNLQPIPAPIPKEKIIKSAGKELAKKRYPPTTRPKWVPDKNHKCCQICETKFSITHRRVCILLYS